MRLSVRRLGPDDALPFQSLRLEGLSTHPEAFGADHAAEAAMPPAAVVARLERNVVFGAFDDVGCLMGVVGLQFFEGEKVRHKGYLWGMYVRPAARGSGASALLVERLIEHATGLVEVILLGVGPDNHPARKLYEQFGFVPYGLEPRGYKIGVTYVDDLLMTLDLRGAEPASGLASRFDRDHAGSPSSS